MPLKIHTLVRSVNFHGQCETISRQHWNNPSSWLCQNCSTYLLLWLFCWLLPNGFSSCCLPVSFFCCHHSSCCCTTRNNTGGGVSRAGSRGEESNLSSPSKIALYRSKRRLALACVRRSGISRLGQVKNFTSEIGSTHFSGLKVKSRICP